MEPVLIEETLAEKDAEGEKRKPCDSCHLGRYRSLVWSPTVRLIKPDALVDDMEFDNLISLRISDHADGIEAVLNAFDLLFEHFPEQDDAFITYAEALLSAISHDTLCFPGHRVLRRNHAHVVFPWPFF